MVLDNLELVSDSCACALRMLIIASPTFFSARRFRLLLIIIFRLPSPFVASVFHVALTLI